MREALRNNLVALISACLAAAVAIVLGLLFPFGNDTAAHLYLTSVFAHSGFSIWDNFWYFGRFDFVGYSYLYYPLASLVGVKAPAVAGLALFQGVVAARLFDRRSTRNYVLASLATAISVGALILTGAYPFLSAMGLSACAVAMYMRRSRFGFAAFVGLAAATSPLSIGGIAFAVAFLGISRAYGSNAKTASNLRHLGRNLASAVGYFNLTVLATVAGATVGVNSYFQIRGSYPYYGSDLAMAVGFCAILISAAPVMVRRGERLAMYCAVGAYLAVNLALFWIHTGIGGNVARVGEIGPTIIAGVALRMDFGGHKRWMRPWLTVGALGAALWMSLSVIAPVFDATQSYLTRGANWTEVVRTVDASYPQRRVEYVDSLLHEGAYFLPQAGIPIARGWFRQDDFVQNSIFYRQELSPRQYQRWLCSNQIAAVVLPPGPYDYSSVQEARLVAGGVSFLAAPVRAGRFGVYRVLGCRAVVPLRIVSATLSLALVPAAGRYVIPLNYSRFDSASFGTLSATSSGRVALTTRRAGTVQLRS